MLSDPEQPIPPLPSVPIYPVAPAPLAALEFPIGWLLDHGSAPIQYRSAVDVARLASGPETALSNLPYSFVPALRLAVAQAADGVWNNAMLTVPPQRGDEFEQVGTVHAVRRLVEYGWSKDSPPVYQARRVLFRLLADDNDPALLFEFAPSPTKKLEPESLMAVRQVLREAAAAALDTPHRAFGATGDYFCVRWQAVGAALSGLGRPSNRNRRSPRSTQLGIERLQRFAAWAQLRHVQRIQGLMRGVVRSVQIKGLRIQVQQPRHDFTAIMTFLHVAQSVIPLGDVEIFVQLAQAQGGPIVLQHLGHLPGRVLRGDFPALGNKVQTTDRVRVFADVVVALG